VTSQKFCRSEILIDLTFLVLRTSMPSYDGNQGLSLTDFQFFRLPSTVRNLANSLERNVVFLLVFGTFGSMSLTGVGVKYPCRIPEIEP
jgi:hypothetical protein